MADLAPALGFTLGWEGGFVDDPLDPGGATKFGITRTSLEGWRGQECSVADVMALSLDEAVAIYTALYWLPLAGPQLPPGLDLVVFDFAVNAGPGRSARMLQAVVGAVQDGAIGPATLRAAACTPMVMRARVEALTRKHEAYYRCLPGFAHDGRGWTARVNAALAAACALIFKPPAPSTPGV